MIKKRQKKKPVPGYLLGEMLCVRACLCYRYARILLYLLVRTNKRLHVAASVLAVCAAASHRENGEKESPV